MTKYTVKEKDISYCFSYDEWWNEVWENSWDYDENEDNYYTIEPSFDPMDTSLKDDDRQYFIYIFREDCFEKYPYMKRAIEVIENLKSWEK